MSAPRRIATAAVLACACVPVAAGCGSSSSGSGTGSTAATGSAGPTSTLKLSTTPRYAAPPATAPAGGTVQVAYRNITISPDALRVRVGTTVRWTNFDPVEHNVTSRSGPQSFASGPLAEGKTFSVKFTHPGVIHYLCTIHPTSMNGTIEVVR